MEAVIHVRRFNPAIKASTLPYPSSSRKNKHKSYPKGLQQKEKSEKGKRQEEDEEEKNRPRRVRQNSESGVQKRRGRVELVCCV
jgi:hypothetical protein